MKRLKKELPGITEFHNSIPDDLIERLTPRHSIAVIDDCELPLSQEKSKADIINNCALIWAHHKQLIIFVLVQGYNSFYKRHPLNPSIQNVTHLILLRSLSNLSSLKHWLKSYAIRLKNSKSLYEIFIEHVLPVKYSYLILDISPQSSKPSAFSQILLSDPRPMLLFSIE